jgi:hypothetical protein
MATYVVIDKFGKKVRQLDAPPTILDQDERLSIHDIVWVKSAVRPDGEYSSNISGDWAKAMTTVMSDVGNGEYNVKIEVISANPLEADYLHRNVRKKLREMPKPRWWWPF